MSDNHTEKTPSQQSAPGVPYGSQKAPDASGAAQTAPTPNRNPFSTLAELAPNVNDAPHIPDSYEVRNLGFMTVITGRNIPGMREMIAAYKESEARNASRNAPRQQQAPAAGDASDEGTTPDAGETNNSARK